MGIAEGPLSQEDEVIIRERFNEWSIEYLQGYLYSYEHNRSVVRKFLEDELGLPEPLVIRAARKAYYTNSPPRPCLGILPC